MIDCKYSWQLWLYNLHKCEQLKPTNRHATALPKGKRYLADYVDGERIVDLKTNGTNPAFIVVDEKYLTKKQGNDFKGWLP